MPFNFFKISEKISNRLTEMLAKPSKRFLHNKGEISAFETLFINMPSNFFKISELISNGFAEMLGQTFKKGSP